jgi:hypothetical protein
MKIFLIIIFASLVILTLVFLLNVSTYNGSPKGRSLEKEKEVPKEISNEKKS